MANDLWRYRVRLLIEREIRLGHTVTLMPYASVEPSFDSRYDAFTRARVRIGGVVPVSTRFAPEFNYTYEHDDAGGRERMTHALGVVMGFYF